MNLREFVTCSHCLRELQPTFQHEMKNAMVTNYHCEQCCYSFSIYAITKTKLVEIQGDKTMKGLYSIEEELRADG